MITLTKSGFVVCDNETIEKSRQEFAQKHCTILPDLIERNLLEKVIQHIEGASFYENHHLTINNVLFASDQSISTKNIALHEVNFLLNNKQLFRFIEQVTGCPEIRGFSGRIYRTMPGQEHYLDWHDDTSDRNRLVGISINLGKEKFEGGVFRIRRKGSEFNLKEVSCTAAGYAHLFNISPQLEHSVTRVTGNTPRTVCAGWFTSTPYSKPALTI